MTAVATPYQWRQAFRPPDRLTATEWSERNLILSERSSPWPGIFRIARSPYLREPIDGASDMRVEEETIVTASQTGKTTAILCQMGYAVDQDPGPGLLVMPNADLAKSFSETRLQPLFDETPAISRHKKPDKDEYKKLEMHFDRLTIALVGANSPANLASRPIRYLWMDEVDKYPPASAKEAAAADLAVERTKRFWNKKIVRTSTPTLTTGEIWKNFLRGDQRYFWVPCPHCAAYQRLVFDGVKWPQELKSSDGKWNLDKVREKTYYECQYCKLAIRDHHKGRMLDRGEWRATGEGVAHRSYQLSALYPLGLRFGDVAAEFLKSKPYPDSLRNFINSWLGEPWEERGDSADESEIMTHCEEYEQLACPENPVVLIVTADVQKDCCYYVVRGWTHEETSFLVRCGVVPDMDSLRHITDATYRSPGGAVQITHGFIDSGYNTDEVYRFCGRYGWMATKGYDATRQAQPYRATTIDGIPLLHIQTDYFKDALQLRLRIAKGDPGAWYLPKNTPREYGDQLAAEAKIEKADRFGRVRHHWKQIRQDNHWLDCEVMQMAAANYIGVRAMPPVAQTQQSSAKHPVGVKRPDGRDWLDVGR